MLLSFGWPAGLNFFFPFVVLREFYGFVVVDKREQKYLCRVRLDLSYLLFW